MNSDIDNTLQQRGEKYGDFKEHARITQNIKQAMFDSPNWQKLDPAKKEALEMVAHKVGRILNGDPDWHDSWHDMIGYFRLVEKDLVPHLFSKDTSPSFHKPPAEASGPRGVPMAPGVPPAKVADRKDDNGDLV